MDDLEPWRRLELIEKAFEAAITQRRFFDAAVIRMHASTFWHEAGRSWLAQTCQAEARSLWLKWGASGLFSLPESTQDRGNSMTRTPLMQYHAQSVLAETLTSLEHIDDPELFIEDAMRALNQVAGSVRAAALLIDTTHEHLTQGALHDQITQTFTLLSHRDLDALARELPLHLIRTVLHGTEVLDIPDARTHSLTRDDMVLRAQGILTLHIMRIPLHMDMQLLIYLDHNQLAEVFTQERTLLVKAQVPMLGFALEALEYKRLTAHHTAENTRNAHEYRKEVIALLENFMAEIHESTMLIEHGASSISPAIQADLLHISRTSNLGLALLHMLGAIETHLLERVTRTCSIAALIMRLNTAHSYTFDPRQLGCKVRTDPDLFVAVIHTMLLVMVPSQASPELSCSSKDGVITLTLSPVDTSMREHVLAALQTPRGTEEVVAEIFARGLRALDISPHLEQPEGAIRLRWDQVR